MDRTADLPIRWHLVGHLQSNKARKAGRRFDVVHSVDSRALARGSTTAPRRPGARSELLVQVDLAGEPTKHGAPGRPLPLILQSASALRRRPVSSG